MGRNITIQNKLEILPGNVLRIPGMEPTTAFTSDTLSVNISEAPCNPSNEQYISNVTDCGQASYIDLAQAVEIITDVTGSPPKIEKALTPSGFPGTGKFLVLPEGSPTEYGCDNSDNTLCNKGKDWYSIFRALAEPINVDELDDDDPRKKCAGFNYSGERKHTKDDLYPNKHTFFNEVSTLYRPADPNIRPNDEPLGGYK